MNAVTITGLNRVSNPKPNKGGSMVLAYFDCEANGFGLHGCALVRTPKHGLTVWPPKLEGPDSYRRTITFTDSSLRHALMLNAREAYRALGGTDAERIGRSIPMGPRTDAGAEDDGETAEGLQRFLASGAAS
jgi:hypothetical protein